MGSRVLVTGAGGFIGSRTATALEAAGVGVIRALHRPIGPTGRCSFVTGPIDDRTDWSVALDGVDVVLHAAARVHAIGEDGEGAQAAYRMTNVDASRHLAASAARAGVKRFVFLSSAGVHGDESDGRPIDERSPLRPTTTYATSKAEAEQALWAVAAATGMEVVALRPPMVYGPGNPGNLPRLMRLILRGVPLPLGAVHNMRSFVGVANLVDAIVRLCLADRVPGDTYLVSDGAALSTPALIRLLAQGMGRTARLVSVPPAWLALGAALFGRRDDLRRLTGSFVLDDTALRTDLAWTPPVDAVTGLLDTGRWFAGQQ